jgi:polyadenylate-binding protein
LDLYKYFTSKGYKLKGAKVVLHKKTSKPLGYGYLQFHSKEEADRCLNDMNNTVLNGLPLRIVHSYSKFEANERANLLVKSIEKDVSQQELYDIFRQYGDIVSCKLETYPDGKSRGYAYIQFATEEEADKAIEAMNDKEINGKKIEVVRHEKKDKRETTGPSKFNNLFVKNLPKGTDDAALKKLFQ